MWLAQQRQAKHFNLHHLADPNLLNSTVYCRRVHDVVVYDTLSVKERRLRKYLTSYIRNRALSTGKGAALWRRLGNPSIEEWGEYLRRHGGFYSFGEGNWINPSAYFADPGSMIIGNNVHITGGFFTCHDGSVNMINRAYKTKLDAVGPIRIFDDVFIGYGTIVLPGVSIGPRAVVGAGSVVSRDIPENSVAVGSPAKMVATLDAYIENLKLKNLAYPWRNLIEQRQGEYDPILEPRLQRMRTDHWFRSRIAGSL